MTTNIPVLQFVPALVVSNISAVLATVEGRAALLAAITPVLNALPKTTDGTEPAGLVAGSLYWNGDTLVRKPGL